MARYSNLAYNRKINDSVTGLGLAIAGEAVERLNGKLFC